MTLALLGVTGVWLAGCVWSFTEQRAFARAKGFGDAPLLPLALDGLAASMAAVAFAASLDGRPAVAARLVTAFGVAASAASNGVWAAERSFTDPATVALGVVMPIVANLAFEVLLGELRRQVQRARGMPAPTPIPQMRLIRLTLAPWDTFTSWRRLVLGATATPLAPRPATRRQQRRTLAFDPPTEPIQLPSGRLQDRSRDLPGALERTPDQQPEPEPLAAHEDHQTASETDLPPEPSGNKTADAKAWVRWKWNRGDQPLLTHVNRQVGSDSLIKRRDLTDWRSEWETEQDEDTDDAGPQLRAVGE